MTWESKYPCYIIYYSVKVTYQDTIKKKTLSSGQHHIIEWKVSFNLDKQCTLLHICLLNLGKSFPFFFWNSTADIERTAKLKPVKFRMVTSKYHATSADLSTFFVWICMYLIRIFLNFYWVSIVSSIEYTDDQIHETKN